MNFIILACVLGGVIEPGGIPEVQSVVVPESNLVVPESNLVVPESNLVVPESNLVLGDCCDCVCDCDCFTVVEEVPEPLDTDVGYLVGTGWANPRATGTPLGSGGFVGRNYPVSGSHGVGGFGGGGSGGYSSSRNPTPPVIPEPGSVILFGLGLVLLILGRMYPVGCIRA
jgi:hypothetical protein